MVAALVVAVTAVVAIALIAWFFLTRHHAEDGAGAADELVDTPSERFYGRNPSGPAGADAEPQRPDETGSSGDPPQGFSQ